MPARTQDRGVFVATETFMCDIDGEQITVQRGQTRVRAGHKLLERYANHFEPVDQGVHFDTVEQATAAPGEKRGEPRVNPATKLQS